MNVQEAYTNWSEQYDTNTNRTRDLEATALQTLLANRHPENILEIGCGTGKNTVFLQTITNHVLAVDLTAAMLAKAREKADKEKVQFAQADITQPWTFATQQYHFITFSLVLEHIEQLEPVLEQAAQTLQRGGLVYIGELHPFKQYSGTKARFHAADGSQTIVDCFTHHTSDFIQAAQKAGLRLADLQEFFDADNRETTPRILAMLFTKP